MIKSRSPSVGKASPDGHDSSGNASARSSLARWRERQDAEAAAGTACRTNRAVRNTSTSPTAHDEEPAAEEEGGNGGNPSMELSFGFSSRLSGQTGISPFRRTVASSTLGAGSAEPPAQRRPPVDAERIGSQWEARYEEERTPHALLSAISHQHPQERNGRNGGDGVPAERNGDSAVEETTDLLAAFRTKEREALEARRSLLEAEALHKREMEAIQRLLASEKTERQKAERDVEELLSAHAQTSASVTPKSFHLGAMGGVAVTASVDTVRASTVSAIDATATSDAFWQKMKEREERARAKVRKEFIQDFQQKLYTEQDKRAEAEKTAKEAERRMKVAEDRAADRAEAVKEAQRSVDALKGVVSEREVRISELESQVALLTRQLHLREEDREKERVQLLQRHDDLQALVQLRERALDEQRSFAQSLLKELGIKDKDLLDHESVNEAVRREIQQIQGKCKAELDAVQARCRDRELALSQERELQVTAANALKEQCEDYRKRIAVLECELTTQQGKVALHAQEGESQRQRLQDRLVDLGVEKRSLELQLERVSAAAGRYARDYSATKESERQTRETLVRRYTAEVATLQEEVARLAQQRKRDQERSLQEILQLSQELTTLKELNTRYEHALNVLEHDRSRTNLQLGRAKEEHQLLLQERRRDSVNTPDSSRTSLNRNAGGKLSAVHDASPHDPPPMDDKDRQIAELHAARSDLRESLAAANARIRFLEERLSQGSQRPQHQAGPLSLRSSSATEELKRRQQQLQDEVRRLQQQRDALQSAVATHALSAPPPVSAVSHRSGNGAPSSASAAAIFSSLANMVRLLEENMAFHRQPHKQRSASGRSGKAEDSEYYFKHAERQALEQVLSSCLAALDCLQVNRSGSPYFSEGESSFTQTTGRKADAGHPHPTLLSSSRAAAAEGDGEDRTPPSLLRGNVPLTALVGEVTPSPRDDADRHDGGRLELPSEPWWDDGEGGSHHKGDAGLHRAQDGEEGRDSDEDSAFIPHHGVGILRYSPVDAALPQFSAHCPSPLSDDHRVGPGSNAAGRSGGLSSDPAALFTNVHVIPPRGALSASSSASPVNDIDHPPRRSSPPPPRQHLRRQQSV